MRLRAIGRLEGARAPGVSRPEGRIARARGRDGWADLAEEPQLGIRKDLWGERSRYVRRWQCCHDNATTEGANDLHDYVASAPPDTPDFQPTVPCFCHVT